MEFRIIIFLLVLLFLSSSFAEAGDFKLTAEKEKSMVKILNDARVHSWCKATSEIKY